MNWLQVISIILAAAVFLVSVVTSTDNPMAMVDYHGILIVIGGTVAASSVSFQLDRVFLMLKVFWKRTMLGRKPDYQATIIQLMKLAELYRTGSGELEKEIENCSDEFIKEGMQSLIEGVVTGGQLFSIMRKRVDTIYEAYAADANRFKSMGKYPPAMGLMGAVLGMIALLAGLGKPGAEKTIGPAMSIALIATLYGIAVANLIIIPIGENLTEAAKEVRTKNNIVVAGLKLISSKTNPIVLAEELNSFLLPGKRVDWKELK